jgi:hypothetical protein
VACAAVVPVKRVEAQDRVAACGGHGVCSVCRMNPVAADHLRAQSDLTWRKGSQRLKESTAAPSWTHSQSCYWLLTYRACPTPGRRGPCSRIRCIIFMCYTATDPTVLTSVASRSATESDSVLWYYCTHCRSIVRRRLRSAPQRHLACADDKRNKRWPLAQSHQGTTPAVSSSTDAAFRSRYQAREQKADGAWRWKDG